jgi:hypothetical protein
LLTPGHSSVQTVNGLKRKQVRKQQKVLEIEVVMIQLFRIELKIAEVGEQ